MSYLNQKKQEFIRKHIPLYIKQTYEELIKKQYIIGITGEIASGKSYVTNKFLELGNTKGIKTHNIDLDYIGHQILGDLKQPIYDEARTQIVETFGVKVRNDDGTINRKNLGTIVFSDSQELDKLNKIMKIPLATGLNNELYGKTGLILFNAALIAENNKSYISNNNTVLIYVNKETQEKRLRARGLNEEQIIKRLGSQYSFLKKKEKLEDAIKKEDHGKIWVVDTSEGSNEIEMTFERVISDLKVRY